MIPILAYNYTARNKERMKETIRFSRMCGLIVAAFSIVLYELAAPQIMQIFINESQTVALGASFLRARCLATPFMFMAFHTLYSFQAMGEGKIALKLAVLRQLILYIPILWIMDRLFGMYGLVWAQLIGDIFTDIVSISWFNKKINEEP
jgi:Na+-driven multidrug efflux pump